MNMLPMFLEILFWFYTRPEDYKDKTSPAYGECVKYLQANGLIEKSADRDWQISGKGCVYVQAILEAADRVPLPYYTCELIKGFSAVMQNNSYEGTILGESPAMIAERNKQTEGGEG